MYNWKYESWMKTKQCNKKMNIIYFYGEVYIAFTGHLKCFFEEVAGRNTFINYGLYVVYSLWVLLNLLHGWYLSPKGIQCMNRQNLLKVSLYKPTLAWMTPDAWCAPRTLKPEKFQNSQTRKVPDEYIKVNSSKLFSPF